MSTVTRPGARLGQFDAHLRGRRAALEARAAVRRAVRAYFDGEGFLEVETPARVRSPGQEVHLDAFAAGPGRFLATSPEYHMKRLVAAGYERVVQIGRVFRAAEVGPLHEPEFTMVEWYRAGAPLDEMARDCERLLQAAGNAVRPSLATGAEDPRARRCNPPFARTTIAELFRSHAGFELRGDEDVAELRARAAGAGLDAGGIELCNAFGELTDPTEQRARFQAEATERGRRGKVSYPIDEALLEALGRMPPTSGAAMGLDRLCLFLLGKSHIREVVAFADDEV